MLASIAKINNTNFQPVLRKNTINNQHHSASKSIADTFVNSKRNNNISFGSFFNDGDYSFWDDEDEARKRRRFKVSSEDKINLNRPLKLSSEEINHIIRTAPSREHGLLTVYQGFSEDANILGKSIGSMANIMNEFNKNVGPRLKTISKIDPPTSHIPIIGIFTNLIQLGGGFFERVDSFTNEIVNEFTENAGKNFNEKLIPKFNEFGTNANHIVNKHLDYSNPKHVKISNRIIQGTEKAQNNVEIVYEKLKKQGISVDSAIESVFNAQHKRQGIRGVIKGLTFGLDGGLTEHIVHAGHDVITDAGHDLLASAKHDLFSQNAIKSLSSIGLDNISKML